MHFEFFPEAGGGTSARAFFDFPAGLLYGAGVYTTFTLPLPERWMDAHWERLESDASAAGLAWPFSRSDLHSWVERCVARVEAEARLSGCPVVRLTLVPDVAGYGDFYAGPDDPLPVRLFCSLRGASPSPAGDISLKTVRHERFRPQVKWNALSDVIMLRREAMREGFHEILLVNGAGNFSEAGTANVFFMEGDRIETPDPVQDGCLPGITRRRMLEAADALGIGVRVTSFPVDRLGEIQGAFLTNAAQGLLPVGRIDGYELPWGGKSREQLARLHDGIV